MKAMTVVSVMMVGLSIATSVSAQTLVGVPERVYGDDDVIDGETITQTRESAVDDAGNVASQPSAEFDSRRIVVATFNGVPTVVARRGDPVAGGGLIEIFSSTVEIFGTSVVYRVGGIDNDLNNLDGDSALLLRDLNQAGSIIIARTNVTPVPGRAVVFTQLGGSNSFGATSGRVAFIANYTDGPDEVGVYLWEGGTLSTVVDTTDSFGGIPFTTFNRAKPDENGPGIVFEARRQGGGQDIRSVFVSDGGNLTELISTGDPFPGTTSSITSLPAPPDIDGGRVVVLLEGSGGELGIFVVDGPGNTTLVADLTTPLPDNGPSTGTATDFSLSVGIGGDLVFF